MKKIIFLITLIFLCSCKKDRVSDVSFYYWKTKFDLSKDEKQTLNSNEVKKIYVRYFDVELVNNQPFPVTPIHFVTKKVAEEIIPVVFIKNEVFLSKQIDLADLKSKVLHLINQIDKANYFQTNEIQIDCDWSLSSREKYMQFLSLIKKDCAKKLSTTIRLHQIKYFEQTKVPPVDYGVLMFYNMGKLSADDTSNSIYDKNIALNYIYSLKKYPLKLKIALPIFSWWIHSRNKKILNLISNLNVEDFKNNPNFELDDNVVYVNKDNLFKGFYFAQGDKLKLEQITKSDLEEMTEILSNKLEYSPEEIIFYDLNTNNIKNFPNDNFFKNLTANF